MHGHNTAAARQASERDVLHRLCFRLHDEEIWGWTARDLLHDLAAYPVDWTPVVAALELRLKKPGPTGAPWPVKVARKVLMRALDQGVTGYELGVALRQAGHPLLCDLVEWRLNRNPLAYKPEELARRYAAACGFVMDHGAALTVSVSLKPTQIRVVAAHRRRWWASACCGQPGIRYRSRCAPSAETLSLAHVSCRLPPPPCPHVCNASV